MKNFLKKFIPSPLLSLYHFILAYAAALFYGFPSRRLAVIGVTGTKGKSTTVNLISRVLEEAGIKTGISSGLNFKIGNRQWLSSLKMTMPGRFSLQRLLKQMVRAGCDVAIVETTSEGIAQHRHRGVSYDVLVFTNLYPEHIEAHGGFENYKQAKLELFRYTSSLPPKKIKNEKIPRAIVVNMDDGHAEDFSRFPVSRKIGYGMAPSADFRATDVSSGEKRTTFSLIKKSDQSKTGIVFELPGLVNVYNALAAIATSTVFEVDELTAKKALAKVGSIPGRMERIIVDDGTTVVVDYAHEPGSFKALYEAIDGWPHQPIIHVFGPTGGGRDRWRRPVMGEIAAKNANIVILTTDDPYDDDPLAIAKEVGIGAIKSGKKIGLDLFYIIDRRKAIRRALELATPNTLILITGKGAEQAMVLKGNRKIPWDDRKVVREELGSLAKNLR